MTYGTVQANAIQGSINTFSPNSAVFRNRIINGAMVIDQRNAGASVTPTTDTYILDRWQLATNVSSKVSVQQSSTAPTGFSNSTLITSLSAYSIGAGELCVYRQKIEGFNTADLGFGTANAKTVTLSFWVRSSLTGTFGGAFTNSAENRSYPYTYTISSANTWEQKTITIAGDTTGTWIGSTNGVGLEVIFGIGVGTTYSGTANAWAGSAYFSATGATSVVGTNGATFYITGVQLEVGSTATSFDYRPYGTELALCQRYCAAWSFSGSYTAVAFGQASGATQVFALLPFPVTPRVVPTGIVSTGTYTSITSTYGVGGASAIAISAYSTPANLGITMSATSGLSAGNATNIACVSTGTIYTTGSEL